MSVVKIGFDLGAACQSIYNVYESGKDFYQQVDLIGDIVQQIAEEEGSWFFLLQYCNLSMQMIGERRGDLFFKESLARTVNGIKVLVEVVFASISVAGSFCRAFDEACKSLQSAWDAGLESVQLVKECDLDGAQKI
jgi:hypothetical protein